MKKNGLILISLCVLLVSPSCKQKQDEPSSTTTEKKVEEKVKKKLQMPKRVDPEDATLNILNKSDDIIGIDLNNTVPVRILQFNIKGVKIKEIRTTKRTEGFSAKHIARKDNKIVILSPSDKAIAPGSGLIAEIICDKVDSANLSDIKIVH